MPVHTLMYVCGKVGVAGGVPTGVPLNSSRLANVRVSFVRNSVFGKRCLQFELRDGNISVNEQIVRLLKLLPARKKAPNRGERLSVIISVACLAVHADVTASLKATTLRKILQHHARLKILVISMDDAKAYRAMLMSQRTVTE